MFKILFIVAVTIQIDKCQEIDHMKSVRMM